jgi:hypothetical protein
MKVPAYTVFYSVGVLSGKFVNRIANKDIFIDRDVKFSCHKWWQSFSQPPYKFIKFKQQFQCHFTLQTYSRSWLEQSGRYVRERQNTTEVAWTLTCLLGL